MPGNKSPHILNTSSNLLGFCLVVFTSLKISNYNANTLIDEFTAFSSVLLVAACILSFLAIRSSGVAASNRLEFIADICFLIALGAIFLIIMLITFNVLA